VDQQPKGEGGEEFGSTLRKGVKVLTEFQRHGWWCPRIVLRD
jgi:hypothetical protein